MELSGNFTDTPVLRELLAEENETAAVDDKGRPLPESMTDSQMLMEILTTMRSTADALESFVGNASKNPMLKMLGLKG